MRKFGGQIKEMYSECQPCVGTNKCRRELADAGISTSWSWNWTTSAEGSTARTARAKAVTQVFADALSGNWRRPWS
ncbi:MULTISPECIES: nucleic acid/nucleotide deaminase domain-containing protein [unclassified Micromonospora]|uniref:nucleic acid/nucleotide deaminase domain-containing protein n=1 Tax=unclassified Micromonospora TaxID=2617518 RepID=UPI0033337CDD